MPKLLSLLLSVLLPATMLAQVYPVDVVSVTAGGVFGNGPSEKPAISHDGGYMSYLSYASNLVPADGNTNPDVYLKNLATGETSLVSVSAAGGASNASSVEHNLASGDYVVFTSLASNLVANDTNTTMDVFLRNMQTATTVRASVSSAGAQGAGAEPVTSYKPCVSLDGRFVVFQSAYTNLVDGDTNAYTDIFVRDMVANTTTRVSVGNAGEQGNDDSSTPSCSADGRYIVFASEAGNLVPSDGDTRRNIFLVDRDVNSDGVFGDQSIQRLDETPAGGDADFTADTRPHISPNGRWIVYASAATNIAPDLNYWADILRYDRLTDTTQIVSLTDDEAGADGHAAYPTVSNDGNFVTFYSSARNLVAGDNNTFSDIFVRDIAAGTTTRVSVGPGGVESNKSNFYPRMSAYGALRIVWNSEATNLVSLVDNNSTFDVFITGLLNPLTESLYIPLIVR